MPENPQAFPRPCGHTGGGAGAWSIGSDAQDGMTLRDYFAAKAMQAEIVTSCSDATPRSASALYEAARANGQTVEQRIAFNAYRIADAMLTEREK